MQKMPNCTVSGCQRKKMSYAGPKIHARSDPSINGPMNAGSCQLGSTTGNPVTSEDEELVESSGGSTMVILSMGTTAVEREDKL